MSFPRYADRKDSGISWLGEVPVHWRVTRMRALFREVIESGEDGLGLNAHRVACSARPWRGVSATQMQPARVAGTIAPVVDARSRRRMAGRCLDSRLVGADAHPLTTATDQTAPFRKAEMA